MALTRWSPTSALTSPRDLLGIQEEVNRLFDSFFGPRWVGPDGTALFTPAVDIEETPETFILRADLPGMSQKDVKVSLTGDTITIRGERKQESRKGDANMQRSERVYGAFERSFTLGAPVDKDRVKATYRDGVLEIVVPKAEEARQKEVEIHVAV
jgi:HSP20 family protein